MNTKIKVICLQNDPNRFSRAHYFTIGKSYDCHFISDNYYIKNDKGQTKQFTKWMLYTDSFKMVDLDEYRNKQIDEIVDFQPKKNIWERYASTEVKRDKKIDNILK